MYQQPQNLVWLFIIIVTVELFILKPVLVYQTNSSKVCALSSRAHLQSMDGLCFQVAGTVEQDYYMEVTESAW